MTEPRIAIDDDMSDRVVINAVSCDAFVGTKAARRTLGVDGLAFGAADEMDNIMIKEIYVC